MSLRALTSQGHDLFQRHEELLLGLRRVVASASRNSRVLRSSAVGPALASVLDTPPNRKINK
jgi:hypothetical protein